MASVSNKENAGQGSGSLFSPSKYAKHVSRVGSSEGLFGRILQAQNEAKTECDAKLAAKVLAKERALEEARRAQEEEEEKKSLELAERLHQEAKDGLVAQQLSVMELDNLNKWKREVATIEAEDRKMVEKLLEAEAEQQRQLEEQARRDSEAAAKLQESEVAVVHTFVTEVSKKWRKPKIVCSDVEDGMLIAVCLPHVGTMKVHVDDKDKVITVVASPDFSYVAQLDGKVPAHMQPKAVDINLDLKIVGKDDVSIDDVKTRYDAPTETAYIFVRNACLRTNKSAFVGRLKSGLKRLLRRPSFMSKK